MSEQRDNSGALFKNDRGDMQMFVNRLIRDDQAISHIETEARVFLAEVEDIIARLTTTYRTQDAAE